jgi:hypothetical protein
MVKVYPDKGSSSRDYDKADNATVEAGFLLVRSESTGVVAIYSPGSWNRVDIT